ncbi:response regulator [Salegentibacter chungangensis]|uniref:Response regulator n=1 Tax=Salegentibacter chungangensis TaxID=1335724 RepID=A0ABW3NT10_9FLAO
METKSALLIQEDIIMLKILERLILSRGYSCRAITSLDELDIEDQTASFDFIICDILFEGIAPLEFVAQVQEIILHKNLVIVTNMGQKNIQDEIMAMEGVSGFFPIPFDLEHIETMMEAYE